MLADAVRDLVEQPQIPELLFDLLDGLGKGVGSAKFCGVPVMAGNPVIMSGLTRVS
jgi:hypothetical protein